jgi:hypothetical protein
LVSHRLVEILVIFVAGYSSSGEVGEFDPASGTLVRRCRRDDEPEGAAIGGCFEDLEGTIAVLYRVGDDLWLRLGDHAANVTSGDARVKWKCRPWQKIATLALIRNGEVLASVKYSPDLSMIAWNNPTRGWPPREYGDFGLFVHKLLADKRRADGIYRPRAEQ